MSNALATNVKESKNLFEKMFFVDYETRYKRAEIWPFSYGFISNILAAAVLDFGLDICFSLNRNCRFRLEFYIWSGSVRVILPFYPVPRPIIAKFFRSSQPIAPEPTINDVEFFISWRSYLPTTISNPLSRWSLEEIYLSGVIIDYYCGSSGMISSTSI